MVLFFWKGKVMEVARDDVSYDCSFEFINLSDHQRAFWVILIKITKLSVFIWAWREDWARTAQKYRVIHSATDSHNIFSQKIHDSWH